MTWSTHARRAAALVSILIMLIAAGACVRLRESSSAGEMSKAQVVTTGSPESTVAPTTPEATQAATTPAPTSASEVTVAVATSTAIGPTPTRAPCAHSAFEDTIDVDYEERDDATGAPRNAIKVCNRKDDNLRIRGRVQLNRISGDTVRPVNHSLAWSSCDACKSVSVALQMNLISRGASTIVPRNEADAYNYQCDGCITVALAYQYVHQVDNPNEVPENVRRLISELNAELRALNSERGVTLEAAIPRIQGVIDRFYELNVSLDQKREDSRERSRPREGDDLD
jgi:hypothetical protein